jgi:hypothetical protein
MGFCARFWNQKRALGKKWSVFDINSLILIIEIKILKLKVNKLLML